MLIVHLPSQSHTSTSRGYIHFCTLFRNSEILLSFKAGSRQLLIKDFSKCQLCTWRLRDWNRPIRLLDWILSTFLFPLTPGPTFCFSSHTNNLWQCDIWQFLQNCKTRFSQFRDISPVRSVRRYLNNLLSNLDVLVHFTLGKIQKWLLDIGLGYVTPPCGWNARFRLKPLSVMRLHQSVSLNDFLLLFLLPSVLLQIRESFFWEKSSKYTRRESLHFCFAHPVLSSKDAFFKKI